MKLLDNLKEKIKEIKEKNEERRKFKKLVEEEILPLRRAGYLEQKRKQAIEEGKEIAKKELIKKQENITRNYFGIPQISPTRPAWSNMFPELYPKKEEIRRKKNGKRNNN